MPQNPSPKTATVYGYARVSTRDQDVRAQIQALAAHGVDHLVTEQCSTQVHRPERDRLLRQLDAGDSLVICRLDRLGRSVRDLIEVVEDLKARGVHLVSLQERIDTSTAAGSLVFHLFAAFAEFERELIRERTRAGLAAAAAAGKRGGRPRVMTPERREAALGLIEGQGYSVARAAAALGVSESTLRRALRHRAPANNGDNKNKPDNQDKSDK